MITIEKQKQSIEKGERGRKMRIERLWWKKMKLWANERIENKAREVKWSYPESEERNSTVLCCWLDLRFIASPQSFNTLTVSLLYLQC